MANQSVKRRLAAIVAADVAGYSRLLEVDEAGTLAALKERRQKILNPLVRDHDGRLVKVMGDGVLIEFASAVNAVTFGVELQRRMMLANQGIADDGHIVLRIGINLGDVIVEGSDLYGDGVVIAVRLQAMAEPGGIFVSSGVHDQVGRKLALEFDDLGLREIKNASKPVHVLRVRADGYAAISGMVRRAIEQSKPSVAVLPFANMSEGPEQEYFSDGISEDIITDLSKVSGLNVVPRNTAFLFKGKALAAAELALRLQVGYVLTGSVRRTGPRVRITAQLIDVSKDHHIWGERYDRDLTDIFALQDEITQSIVDALKVKLLPMERQAIDQRSTRNTTAYEVYLQGRHYYRHYGWRNLQIAIRFAKQALDIDPHYAMAWVLIAVCQSSLRTRGQGEESGLAAADRALSLDPALPEAHGARGRVLGDLGRFDEADAEFQEAMRLDPDSHEVRFNYGRMCHIAGRDEKALEHFERAAELGEGYTSLCYAAQIYGALGQREKSEHAARRAWERVEREVALQPDNAMALSFGVGLLVQLGEKQRAKEWIDRTLIVEPEDTVTHHNLACSLAQMGEAERALDILEYSSSKMAASVAVQWIENDSDLASLRGHPRYQQIIAKAEARLGAVQGGQAADA